MTQKAKQLLYNRVSNAKSINDILPLLHLIPLEPIQDVVLNAIMALDPNTANDIQYKCLSVTDILPQDIIQHIVSFGDSLKTKYINKAFNNGYTKNQRLQLTQLQQIIDTHEFNPTIPQYEEGNKTWILHPTRTHLNSDEITKGYEALLNDLNEVRDVVQSGDKLLFHDGEYAYQFETDEDLSETLFSNYDLQLIGLGKDVFIKMNSNDSSEEKTEIQMWDNNCIYFKNVKMQMDVDFELHGAEISMEDCKIELGSSNCFVSVFDTGTFNAKHCVFSGQSERARGLFEPIYFGYGAHVNLVGCTFLQNRSRMACIQLIDDESDYPLDETFLKCVGNIFEDNWGYPITMDQSIHLRESHTLKSLIRHNILRGYNGVKMKDVVDTANKIYIV
eukprot:273868_1